ncbi:MAG: T9SS type A sorting domain-containing protein [Cytophagales bacterium]|nr:T9SS type A sorting domain-containing protein [Cytophagales bacterium]
MQAHPQMIIGGVQGHIIRHLTINKGLNDNTWNLIWTAYEGTTVSTYNIYRGTSSSNLAFVNGVSGNNTSFTDSNAPVSGTLYYQVEVVTGGCNPTARTEAYTSSKSNIAQAGNTNISSDTAPRFTIVPNPNAGSCKIISQEAGTLTITNVIGQVVYTNTGQQEYDIQGLTSGIYIVQMNYPNKVTHLKMVVE